jgi:phospholipid transport system substrate-binding protein
MKRISITPMRTNKLAALAIAVSFGAVALARAAESPRALVEQTTTAVLSVLADKKLPAEQKKEKVEAIAVENMDFRTLSRLTLAKNWQSLNDQQRDAFMIEFKRHLSVTYGHNVESYNNEKVQVVGEREEQRGDWTVKTQVIRAQAQPVSMDYRVRKVDGQWKIIDVVIEGVSLVSNYRSEFQDIISSKGFDELLRILRDKNAKGEPLKKA